MGSGEPARFCSSCRAAASTSATRARKVAAISSAFSYTSAGSRTMSPGLGSSLRVDSAIRVLSASWLRIITLSLSPMLRTASTLVTRSWLIWLTWSSPLVEPRLIKAPYGFTASTVPSTTSPTLKSWSDALLSAFLLLRTRRWRSSSTSSSFTRMRSPRMFSGVMRMLRWLAGTKPLRCSTSTMRPPRLTLSTVAMIATSSACIWRRRCQTRAYSISRRESWIMPSRELSRMMRNSR
mmetsp:Transcript_32000/g.76035  ORF Transcript_32000/g.76035 Transcript_32000/m.76035 type:complete len:237 (+) Transcript_32000:146-856(+)